MKLTAQPVAYSSVVGSSIMLTDESGAVIAQLGIMVPRPDLDYREIAEAITPVIVQAFERDKE